MRYLVTCHLNPHAGFDAEVVEEALNSLGLWEVIHAEDGEWYGLPAGVFLGRSSLGLTEFTALVRDTIAALDYVIWTLLVIEVNEHRVLGEPVS